MPGFPVIGPAAGVLDQVALDHQVSGVVLGIDAAVGSGENAPHPRAPDASPSRDVAVLDHHVLDPCPDEHAVDARVLQLQAPEDGGAGFYHYVVIREVEHVT